MTATAAPSALRFAGQEVELAISEVSERTIRIQLTPFDQGDRAQPAMATSVLVPFASTNKIRVREIDGVKELSVGRLRVSISARDRKSVV